MKIFYNKFFASVILATAMLTVSGMCAEEPPNWIDSRWAKPGTHIVTNAVTGLTMTNYVTEAILPFQIGMGDWNTALQPSATNGFIKGDALLPLAARALALESGTNNWNAAYAGWTGLDLSPYALVTQLHSLSNNLASAIATNHCDKLWSGDTTYADGDLNLWQIGLQSGYLCNDPDGTGSLIGFKDQFFGLVASNAATIVYSNITYGAMIRYELGDDNYVNFVFKNGVTLDQLAVNPPWPNSELIILDKGSYGGTFVLTDRIVTNIVDRAVTANESIIITAQAYDAAGTVTQQVAQAGSLTITSSFFGRSEALAAIGAVDLNSRVPYSGATGDLNMGANTISAGKIQVKQTSYAGTAYTTLNDGSINYSGGGINNNYLLPRRVPGSQYTGFIAVEDYVDGAIADSLLLYDSATNVVWRNVYSNGWHILQAYTNTPGGGQ